MKKIKIDDICEIADQIIKYADDTDNDVVVVGYSETIGELFNYLIKETDSELVDAEFSSPEIDGYDEAYYIIYDKEEIWLGRAYSEDHGKYIKFCHDMAYVEEDFLDDFKETNSVDNVVVFGFTDVNDEDEDDNNVSICMDDDECGFCFCIGDDVNHTKFKFRGNKKLTPEKVSEIINEYVF